LAGKAGQPGESTHPYGSFIDPNGSMNQALRHVIFKQSCRMMIFIDAQVFDPGKSMDLLANPVNSSIGLFI
jgi:hypothetical protein